MLRTYFQETFYDMPVDIAQKYADAIRDAILSGASFEGEKKQGFFISKQRGFEDKLYVGDIHRIENRLEWNGEELAEDDEIINVIMVDGPVTRDGDGCSYGSKDHRDQILYANTIPQVVGHIFIINTPGGACSARIDYEQAIADCREKGKPTVAWVDGMCCSAGQLIASLCDRTIAMNGRNTMGCIGTMCAFWGVPNGTVDRDGYRYIELVSVTSPDKNAEYREACDGKTEKLQAELDVLGEEFRQTVKANRPLVKEEHLTGKTFDAQDVMGALVDEIGDYVRAIEAVFELVGGTLTAARAIVPGEDPAAGPEGEGSEDMAQLTDQQKAAITANAKRELTIGEGKVEKTVYTMFGPEQQEIGKPQNNNNMTEEEKKAAEAEAAKAAAQEQPATEEQPAGEGAPANEEQPATEEQPAGEEAPANEEQPATEEQPAAEGAPAEKTIEEAEAEIDRISETLRDAEAKYDTEHAAHELLQGEHAKLQEDYQAKSDAFAQLADEHNKQSADLVSAKELIAERDKTIETLTADKEALNGVVAERDKTIEELRSTVEAQKKQLSEKEAEIKELSEKPTPMVDAAAGIPADNGTGGAPKQKGSAIKYGMSYKEIRAARKQ